MSTASGTLQSFIIEFERLLKPLQDELSTPAKTREFFVRVGIVLTEADAGAVSGSATGLVSALQGLADEVVDIISHLAAESYQDLAEDTINAIHHIATIINGTTTLGNQVHGIHASLSAEEIAKRIINYLVFNYIENTRGVNEGLELLGLLDREEFNADSVDPSNPEYELTTFRFDRIGNWFSDPANTVKDIYDWGKDDFDGAKFFSRFEQVLSRLGLPVLYDDASSPKRLDLIVVEVVPKADVTPHGLLIRLKNTIAANTITIPLGDMIRLELNAAIDTPKNTGLYFLPNGTVAFQHPDFLPGFGGEIILKFILKKTSPPEPIIIFGEAGGSRFEMNELILTTGTEVVWTGSEVAGTFQFEVAANGLKVIIDASKGDGFLTKIMPGTRVEADFDLVLGVSTEQGFYIRGSSALEIRLPTHIEIGPISFEGLTIAAKLQSGKIPISLGADIRAELGPLVVIVQNMGVTATFSFPPNNSGNLGPLQLDLGFKPPNGVGLSLDAGGFKGGGFLMFDSAKGEYAGALELDFQGMFSVKAIGIINTKMPDGSDGFSLLIIIAAEFTPIQLSFGFTLNGVGGIIGLNRSINVSALVDGIRTNAIKSILFPQDVIANITRIISDVKQFFPVQQDHFVVGPMAKLGWGSIITVELGLLLDLPNPMVAIVGVLKAVIPAEEAPIIRLQVNFIGILDFEHGYVFFRADLYDSRLLLFSITGSMAFLVSWGEQKTFALSVGGFHPDFRDIPSIPALPNGFSNMARIGISLLSDDNPRLKVESYFAVTSNTVQFGAKVELYAEAMGFNVYGFLGYDVLFQFEPFHFIAKLYGGIALRSGTSVIAGISISAQLSGPTPWDAQGTASLELFWFLTISVGFHVTWGDPPPAIEPATEDLLALLQRELADTRNWRAEIPANNHLHVSLRQIEPPAGSELLVIHPSGILTFSQRSLPLEDYLIEKFGTKKPLSDNKFKLSNTVSNGTAIPADFTNVREQFAPENFSKLTDSDKLSRKSFEPLPSGFRLTGTSELHVATPVSRPVVYELSYLRRKRIVFKRLIDLGMLTYNRLVKGSAVRQSTLAYQQIRPSLNAPAQVALPEETFAIANTSDLKSHLMDGGQKVKLFATQAEAYQRQQELLLDNPALAGQIQIVSHFELNQN